MRSEPKMFDEKSLSVLKRMVESFGPSGFERETAKIIRDYMKEYSDEILSDKLGSLVFLVKGDSERPHVLIAGHIDEVGFVVSGIDEKTGFLSFNPLGGWFDQVLLSQRVVVRTEKGDLHGVIAAKPPHLLTDEEKAKVVTQDKMYIDIGATSGKEAIEAGVKIGDPVVPWSPFSLIRQGKVAMGKAFDDRIGAFVMMETIRRIRENHVSHPNTVYGAATVQEEVGLRGAQTVAYLVDPDVAIVLEVDISGDAPDIKPSEAPAKMGKGPSLVTYDRSMIPNQPLKEFVIKVAKETGIPLQLSQVSKGGTDAGRIHLNRVGCPSVVLSVPTRHIHSHVGLLSLEDVENTVKLTLELIKRLDKRTVESFTEI
ncbi:MAG: M42 family metallopeptidase [Nitrososphaerota archaeon]|nr:M42 family metallopeptidase [Candidatus Bathyarchaeota archaeon]MDW8048854.1 M42 family metallopeptidase [Nitrososphaerota archaeon]